MAVDPSWRALTGWLDDPPQATGVHFSERGEWAFYPYATLARQVRSVAGWLHDRGVGHGDAVVVAQANTPEFVGSFFGCLLAGATPAPVAPVAAFRRSNEFASFLARVLKITNAEAVLAEPGSATAAAAEISAAGCLLGDGQGGSADGTLGTTGPPSDLAFLQFSSGSQGLPRAVRVPYSAVAANVMAVTSWLNVDPGDVLASWLPLYHDMGLVGCCLTPFMNRVNVWMMQPNDFIRSPRRWLSCFGEQGATIGVTPNFGLRHVLRRVQPRMLDGMDFSPLRALIVGAERIDCELVDAVTRLLAPQGFHGRAMAPAYGMAETVLAVTGSRPQEEIHRLQVDAARLVPGEPVTVTNGGVQSSVGLISCGRPLDGVDVTIVDDDGAVLPEQALGRIRVRGSVVADGYLISADDARSQQEAFDGVFTTGDVGFLKEGELYVVGRAGDSVKCLGRWLYAEDVEDVVARVVPESRPVVVLGSSAESSTALVLLDRRAADQAEKAGRAVTDTFAELRTLVMVVEAGEIQRSTSGKPRRSSIWRSLAGPAMADRSLWDSAHDLASRGAE
jgi:acyl-CoA synthetase (AMP-forming)/AMP-acid ligase II